MPNLPPHNLSHGPLGGDPVLPWDPQNGIFVYDDFNWTTLPTGKYIANSSSAGGTLSYSTGNPYLWGLDNVRRGQGIVELSTGTSGGGGNYGYALSYGAMGASQNGFTPGYGTLTMKTRMAIQQSSVATGIGYHLLFGLWNQNAAQGSNQPGVLGGNPTNAVFLIWTPDDNGGLMRLGYAAGTGSFAAGYSTVAPTYINCTGNAVPTFNNYDWWQLQIDSSRNITALLNGVVIATAATAAPQAPMVPFWSVWRTTGAVNYVLSLDDFYLYYPYQR
jgi:hypothetical protein